MARAAAEDREYVKILQAQLMLACQKLSEEDRELLRTETASALEQPLCSSSSAGDTLGTSSDAPPSPEHRPLRGPVDDCDLNHTVDGFHIGPKLNKE